MNSDFRVGPWLVQPSLNTISQDGTSNRVEPKMMGVLVCLAEHTGEVVPKEKLLQAVWPGTFVSDDVLKRSVSELRRVFGDDAHESRIIETIPRMGYRLVLDVKAANGHDPAHGECSQLTGAELSWVRPAIRKWKIGPLGLGVVLSVCALLVALNITGVRDRLRSRSSPPIRSLAVLPLKNLSDDLSQEYFADGLTEELITELSHIRALKVISRSSAMRYKRTDKSLPEIARALGVEAVVEGSVLRSGDRVRITVQLIYAPKDTYLWAQSYERDLKDILVLQSDIAADLAARVQMEINVPERATRARNTVDPVAYEAYLKGNYYWERYTGPELDRSRESFKKAIALDPDFPRAYSALGSAYFSLIAGDLLPDSALQEVQSLEDKALQLDPSLASAHVTLAWLKIYSWKLTEAGQEAERALQLDASSADAHVVQLLILRLQGKLQISAADVQQIRRLDPASPIALTSLGSTLVGDLAMLDQGLELCREAIELDPNFALGHWCVGRALLGKNQPSGAIAEFRKADAAGKIPFFRTGLNIAYALTGDSRPAIEEIAYLRSKRDRCWCFDIAQLEASLGSKQAALYWLEKAYKIHEPKLVFLNSEMEFEGLRFDPHYKDLLRRIGLPQ